MFAIGDFARHGRVSVRMLRHYDAIGLLRPAHVDPATGYRSYDAGQFAELNRIVALKDLGFSLEQVRTMIADEITPAEVRALLTIRRAELESTVAESVARLAQVESRLRGIEGALPTADVVIKELPAVRLVGLTTTAASFTPEDIGPVIRPLCAELGRRLPDAAVRPAGRLTCLYERSQRSEDEAVVRATVPASIDAEGNLNGLEVVDLPATSGRDAGTSRADRPGTARVAGAGSLDRRQQPSVRRAGAGGLPRLPGRPGPVGDRATGAHGVIAMGSCSAQALAGSRATGGRASSVPGIAVPLRGQRVVSGTLMRASAPMMQAAIM